MLGIVTIGSRTSLDSRHAHQYDSPAMSLHAQLWLNFFREFYRPPLGPTGPDGLGLGGRSPPASLDPEEKAVVYVYRPPDDTAYGLKQMVYMNGQPVALIYRAGYFPYVVEPGILDIELGGFLHFAPSSERVGRVRLDVKVGRTYFARASFRKRSYFSQTAPGISLSYGG